MILILFLAIVFTHLFILDIRQAAVKIFSSKSRSLQYSAAESQKSAKFILRWASRLIHLWIEYDIDETMLPEQFLVVTNHQSLLDILVCMKSFDTPNTRFVAKKELGRGAPGASRVLRYARHALIGRYTDLRGTGIILKRFSTMAKKNKWNPVIFPEGTRSADGKLRRFKPGAYRILQNELRLPTAVAVIDGGYKYSHIGDFLKKNDYFYRIKLLEVLPEPKSKDDIKNDLEKAQKIIQSQLAAWND